MFSYLMPKNCEIRLKLVDEMIPKPVLDILQSGCQL